MIICTIKGAIDKYIIRILRRWFHLFELFLIAERTFFERLGEVFGFCFTCLFEAFCSSIVDAFFVAVDFGSVDFFFIFCLSYSWRSFFKVLSLRASDPSGFLIAPESKPNFFSRLPIFMSDRTFLAIRLREKHSYGSVTKSCKS